MKGATTMTNRELTFTITEASRTGFAIGIKYYTIKCAACGYKLNYVESKDLFSYMEQIAEKFNNMGNAVLFEVA